MNNEKIDEIRSMIDDTIDDLPAEDALEVMNEVAAHVDAVIMGLEDDVHGTHTEGL